MCEAHLGLSSFVTQETTTMARPRYPTICIVGYVRFSGVLFAPGIEPADLPSHSYRNRNPFCAGCSVMTTRATRLTFPLLPLPFRLAIIESRLCGGVLFGGWDVDGTSNGFEFNAISGGNGTSNSPFVPIANSAPGSPLNLVITSTGMKICLRTQGQTLAIFWLSEFTINFQQKKKILQRTRNGSRLMWGQLREYQMNGALRCS